MSIESTLSRIADSLDAMAEIQKQILAQAPTVSERVADAAPAKAKAKAKAEPKAEPAKAEPAKAEPAKAEPAKAEPAKAEPDNGEIPDLDTVRNRAMQYSRDHGRETLVSLLERYGCRKVTNLPEARRAEFLAEMERGVDPNAAEDLV